MILTHRDELEASTRDFQCNESNLFACGYFWYEWSQSDRLTLSDYLSKLLKAPQPQ